MDAAKKKQNRIEEIDSLYDSVKAFRTTERTGELLRFVAKFPGIAPYNSA